MSGISGFFDLCGKLADPEESALALTGMADSLRHRGQHGHEHWLDKNAGIALGYGRRATDMHSRCGRYALVYDGAIHNCPELRKAVEDRTGNRLALRGSEDNELFLEACAVFGVRGVVERCIGTFAFALWDKHERTLTLGRDRFGVKPLFWAHQGDTVIFASELKALRRHPAFRAEICRDALAAYFRCNYLPAPLTIYTGTRQLRPGHLLTVNDRNKEEASWWSALDVALAGVENRVSSHQDAMDELHGLLRDAVRRRMAVDMPTGAFLSGGIDSSLIAALLQEASAQPIDTFSIGFEAAEFNEAPYAKAIAASLGTRHTELYVSDGEVRDLVPKLPGTYSDLLADSSQIPTCLLCALARASVGVVLSGDGGDELFGGYGHYSDTQSDKQWPGRSRATSYQLSRYCRWMDRNIVPKARPLPEFYVQGVSDAMFTDESEMKQYLDTVHYAPSVLAKVERAAVASELDVRPPLLDHRVYALAWRMPPDLRRALGQGKWPLRHILAHYVNPTLTERPKMGFGAPLLHWLRGPLRDWAENLLDPARIRREGWLNGAAVAQMWLDVLAEKQPAEYIWAALMFQAWLEE